MIRFSGIAIVVILWATISHCEFVDPAILCTPWEMIRELTELSQGSVVWMHWGSTVVRTLLAFAIGSTTGVICGLFLGINATIRGMFDPVVDFLRSIPVVALFPLFMIMFGVGNTAKIGTAAWGCFPLVMINTIYGVKQCNTTRQLAARVMGANSIQVFSRIIFWDSLPSIIAGLRIGLSMCLIIVIICEMFLGTIAGLGRMIYDAGIIYQVPRVYAGIFLTGITGYSINKLFLLAEGRLIHWQGR